MSAELALAILAFVVIGGLAFFYPTIIAFKRGTRSRWTILVFNLFFGWTLILWFIALMMAYGPTDAELRWQAEREQLSIDADNALVAMGRRSSRWQS